MDLEQLLVDEGVVAAEAFGEARDAAGREGRALCSVLVERGLAEDVFADVVARHLGTVVIDVELGALDTESVRMVPEEMARRYLAIPVARGPGGNSLRVAFANPLDEEAVAAVGEETGLEVDPLVATVSGVQAAIEREYEGRDTRVIRNPRPGHKDIGEEDTRRVELPEGRETTADTVSPGETSPLHRVEADATVEQRLEALLLALVEAGVLTRSDYLAALKRLMGKR